MRAGPLPAVLMAVLAAALSAVDAAIVRALGGSVHPFMIAFFRAGFGALTVLPMVMMRPSVLRSIHSLPQHAVRAGLKLIALAAFFAAYAQGSLTEVTAIAFTAPIFVVLGAALTLGERLGPARIAAAVVGFGGALWIVGPSGTAPLAAVGFAFLGAILQALVQLMLKSMSSGDRTETLVSLNLLLSAPMALLLALPFWQTPDLHQFALLALQGVLGAVCMALMTHAMSMADASIIAPIEFLRLPFVAIIAWFAFSETVAPATWIGGATICVAALLASRARR